MGDISEMIQEGLLCMSCGGVVEDMEAPGYVRLCKDCEEVFIKINKEKE